MGNLWEGESKQLTAEQGAFLPHATFWTVVPVSTCLLASRGTYRGTITWERAVRSQPHLKWCQEIHVMGYSWGERSGGGGKCQCSRQHQSNFKLASREISRCCCFYYFPVEYLHIKSIYTIKGIQALKTTEKQARVTTAASDFNQSRASSLLHCLTGSWGAAEHVTSSERRTF